MNAPSDLQELIDRHLHGLNSPEESARLIELLITDPRAGAAMAESARFEAMLQQQFPLRRRNPRWKPLPILAGFGAAAAALVILASSGTWGTFGPARVPPSADDEGLHWEPIETAVVPLEVITARAQAEHDRRQLLTPAAFVPAPKLEVKKWTSDDSGKIEVELQRMSQGNTGESWLPAQPCHFDTKGAADLGSGCRISVKWIWMGAGRRNPDTSQGGKSKSQANLECVFDHSGVLLPPGRAHGSLGAGLFDDANATSFLVGIHVSPPSRIRMKPSGILEARSLKEITFLSSEPFRSPVGGNEAQEMLIQGWLTSNEPLTLVLQAAVADSEPFLLPLLHGATAANSIAEGLFLGSSSGKWTAEPDADVETRFRLSLESAVTKGIRNSPQGASTFCISTSRGCYAEVSAITPDGEVAAASSDDNLYWPVSFHRFDVPIESVKALKVQPLSRRTVFLTFTPPVDPMQGLNRNVTDVLELRLPEANDNWSLVAMKLLGMAGSWRDTGTMHQLPLKNATLRELIIESGRKSAKRIEIDVRTRQLRGVPLK